MVSEPSILSHSRPLVVLGLGSNLGDRLSHLRAALAGLKPAYQIAKVSSVYETAPQVVTDQPPFYNLVCTGYTDLTPRDLLRFLKGLEARLGRQERARYGPREIDLDIELYGEQIVSDPDLHIPHPRLTERAFVLIPLAEVAPDLLHPLVKRAIRDLAGQVRDQPVKRLSLVVFEQLSEL